MKVVVTPRADEDIAHQHEWGVARFGKKVTDRIYGRVQSFLLHSLAQNPRSGNRVSPSSDIYETWIPRTPFVLFYRIEPAADAVRILALFRHSQNWKDFVADDED